MGPMDPIVQPNRLLLWQGVEPSADVSTDTSLLQLKEERLRERALFDHQSEETQRFVARQAVSIAAALLESRSRLDFSLPEFVNLAGEGDEAYRSVEVPADFRSQHIGGFLGRLPLKDIRSVFRQRLSRIEDSIYPAVAAGARLLRYAVARHIVQDRIPEANEPIGSKADQSIGTLERKVGEYRRWIEILHQALSLAPYIYTEEEYQAKRAAVLSRLVPFGNTLAQLQLERIIGKIRERAGANDLNRGLSLSLPYFDDRALEMKLLDFEVIPAGRTLFVPAFVALAARREQEKLEQDNVLSPSTRTHLLDELKHLERAFAPAAF
jgi:tetratricopeptide (TPR) repeat protein